MCQRKCGRVKAGLFERERKGSVRIFVDHGVLIIQILKSIIQNKYF